MGALLSPRRWAMLRFLGQFIATQGRAPTIREIARGLGISSPNGVVGHLKDLEERGLIQRSPRTIVLTPAATRWLSSVDQLPA